MADTSPEFIFPDKFGFCGGVAAADQLLRAVADEADVYDIPVFGYHNIVHNDDVVREHEANGVTFVDNVDDIEEGSAVVISAHGASPEVYESARFKNCEIFDATCPLVADTHKEVKIARQNDEKVIYICHGKPGEVEKLHDEVAGTVGHLDYETTPNGYVMEAPVPRTYLEIGEDLSAIKDLFTEQGRYRIVSQTTLHADACLAYRREVRDFILNAQQGASVEWSRNRGNVCRAVADRQDGVVTLVQLQPRQVVVATDPNSKNGMSYVRLAQEEINRRGLDTTVHAVASAEEARRLPKTVGLTAMTASASTPRSTIEKIAGELGCDEVPQVVDRVFKLGDSDPAVIARKMIKHAQRIRTQR